ncbi:MAG: hypothetical protein K0Q97_218 [Bacillota bacterium]|jgi:hypothetical protein|nr:hypothetical protein [Bacillota bacterium]
MKNRNKRDSLFVNEISHVHDVKAVSKEPVGKADENAFCIYNNQSHAVGSRIKNRDDEYICTEDGSWQEKDSK